MGKDLLERALLRDERVQPDVTAAPRECPWKLLAHPSASVLGMVRGEETAGETGPKVRPCVATGWQPDRDFAFGAAGFCLGDRGLQPWLHHVRSKEQLGILLPRVKQIGAVVESTALGCHRKGGAVPAFTRAPPALNPVTPHRPADRIP